MSRFSSTAGAVVVTIYLQMGDGFLGTLATGSSLPVA
jgi:hypothetical protein